MQNNCEVNYQYAYPSNILLLHNYIFSQDFKNFQYTLPRVTGLVIHMEEKKTLVRLPQDRYDEVDNNYIQYY